MENKRKKWTVKENPTAADIKINEKKKWQLALRRYVIEQKPSYQYAPYFGLDIERFRDWIKLQFTEGLNWDNFGEQWQFGHIVPVNYFDFEIEEDLKLCWNFINIQVETIDKQAITKTAINIFSAKIHFQQLFSSTDYSFCSKMIRKIEKLETLGTLETDYISDFIIKQKKELEVLQTLSTEDFVRINTGEKLSDIILELEMIKKFG